MGYTCGRRLTKEFVLAEAKKYRCRSEFQKHDSSCYRDWETDRKSTRLNSSHSGESRMPSSA